MFGSAKKSARLPPALPQVYDASASEEGGAPNFELVAEQSERVWFDVCLGWAGAVGG